MSLFPTFADMTVLPSIGDLWKRISRPNVDNNLLDQDALVLQKLYEKGATGVVLMRVAARTAPVSDLLDDHELWPATVESIRATCDRVVLEALYLCKNMLDVTMFFATTQLVKTAGAAYFLNTQQFETIHDFLDPQKFEAAKTKLAERAGQFPAVQFSANLEQDVTDKKAIVGFHRRMLNIHRYLIPPRSATKPKPKSVAKGAGKQQAAGQKHDRVDDDDDLMQLFANSAQQTNNAARQQQQLRDADPFDDGEDDFVQILAERKKPRAKAAQQDAPPRAKAAGKRGAAGGKKAAPKPKRKGKAAAAAQSSSSSSDEDS